MLLEAVRDAAEQLAGADPAYLRGSSRRLSSDFPVFERIAFHLLRRPGGCSARPGPGQAHQEGPVRFLRASPRIFSSDAAAFRLAHSADREHILGWIEAGPDLQGFIAGHESWFGGPPAAEEIEVFADHYRLERLWPIQSDLPEAWRHRLATSSPVTEGRNNRNS